MKNHVYLLKFYTLLFTVFVSLSLPAQNLHIYASPNGPSTGQGSGSGSPVSLEQAKAVARAHPNQACIIYLASGIYPALSLNSSDSRSATYPVVYVSMQPNGAVFQPETTLNRASFQAIPASIQSRIINATAKTKVMQLPLASLGFTDTAQWPAFSLLADIKSPKFYKDGQPLPMSRYPAASGTMPMRQVVNPGSYKSVPGGSFKYQDDRAKYWMNAINDGGVYLSGNWRTLFEIDVIKTQSVTTADSLILQSIGILGGLGAQPYGRLVSGAEPYYAMNLVEEIAAEGQWSINFKTKMLYMWPPASGTITCAGNSNVPAILLNGVNNTQFINITVRGGSGNGIELHNCNNVQIDGSHISLCSGNGITITDGTYCTVQSNDIDSVGAGGVIISSSNFATDQFNVKLSKHQVINNHIYSYAREAFVYSAAVNLQHAIGTYVAYNKVHDSPHVGILYGGNSNVLEYNEVYDVVKKYTDMGAFYKVDQGEVGLCRGNRLNHNYIHDAPLANGLYADNFASGDSSVYNIIEGVSMGMYNHQGYFTAYANNICVNDTYPATSYIELTSSPTYLTHYNALKAIWTSSAAYRAAYPECADMVGSASPNLAYTSKIWPSFTGCVFTANPGILSYSNIDQLFNKDGTTNTTYAQGTVFPTWNIVWKNDIRLNGTRTKPFVPFTLDSLKATGAFGLTGARDWHVNRIGLHKDSYRTDISSVRIPECDPVMKLNFSSSNNFKTPGVIYLTMGIKFPNAANAITSTYWYDNGKVITGLYIQKKSFSYDSVTYIAQWTNPPAGAHTVYTLGKDGDFWQYTTNTVSFNITAVAATATTDTLATRVGNKLATASDSAAAAASASDSLKAAATNSALSLFPNPASSQINLSYTSSAAQHNVNVLIYDMLGRVMQKKITDFQAGPNTLTLSLGNLPDGNYMLVLQAPHGALVSRRFVVTH